MTDKKEQILQSALKLFAEEGFSTTSTSKIAKAAEVSEGLIFRHFKNKEGLLNAILKMGEVKTQVLFSDIIKIEDPKELIRKAIDIGNEFVKSEEDLQFWKLQFKIKWETENYGEYKIYPLQDALEGAFRKLGYRKPALEARLFTMTFDGLATRLFLAEGIEVGEYLDYMKARYQV